MQCEEVERERMCKCAASDVQIGDCFLSQDGAVYMRTAWPESRPDPQHADCVLGVRLSDGRQIHFRDSGGVVRVAAWVQWARMIRTGVAP